MLKIVIKNEYIRLEEGQQQNSSKTHSSSRSLVFTLMNLVQSKNLDERGLSYKIKRQVNMKDNLHIMQKVCDDFDDYSNRNGLAFS